MQPDQILRDRYQLQHRLGRAPGRQTCWLAQDLSQDPPAAVVVKLLAFAGMQWEDLKLFEREAQVLQHLQHPHIPRYRDSFTWGDNPTWFVLVQDYIPGASLKQLLDGGKHFSEKQILQIGANVLHLLSYLHQLSPPVLHRDIKPSNLILGEDNFIYLVDFGAQQSHQMLLIKIPANRLQLLALIPLAILLVYVGHIVTPYYIWGMVNPSVLLFVGLILVALLLFAYWETLPTFIQFESDYFFIYKRPFKQPFELTHGAVCHIEDVYHTLKTVRTGKSSVEQRVVVIQTEFGEDFFGAGLSWDECRWLVNVIQIW